MSIGPFKNFNQKQQIQQQSSWVKLKDKFNEFFSASNWNPSSAENLERALFRNPSTMAAENIYTAVNNFQGGAQPTSFINNNAIHACSTNLLAEVAYLAQNNEFPETFQNEQDQIYFMVCLFDEWKKELKKPLLSQNQNILDAYNKGVILLNKINQTGHVSLELNLFMIITATRCGILFQNQQEFLIYAQNQSQAQILLNEKEKDDTNLFYTEQTRVNIKLERLANDIFNIAFSKSSSIKHRALEKYIDVIRKMFKFDCFPVDHANRLDFTFFSPKTSALTGLIALSPEAQEYIPNDFSEIILNYIIHDLNGMSPSPVKIKFTCGNTIDEMTLTRTNRHELGEFLLNRLYPSLEKLGNSQQREEMIKFYGGPIRSIDLEFSDHFQIKSVQLRAVLMSTPDKKYYYVHFELGEKSLFEPDSQHKKIRYVMHLGGNAVSQAEQLISAVSTLKSFGGIQLIPDYANKGINHILNGHSAATTSTEGSIDPHLCLYNTLLEVYQKQPDNYELIHCGHSYGNIGGAAYINKILKANPNKKILFFGSATISSIIDGAKAFTNEGTAQFAKFTGLVKNVDVYQTFSHPNVTAICFTSDNDPIIPPLAQIQNDTRFALNESARIVKSMKELNELRQAQELPTLLVINVKNMAGRHGHTSFFEEVRTTFGGNNDVTHVKNIFSTVQDIYNLK